jgi:hypothetical protein
MGEALATLWDFIYRVPAMAGAGDHWPLTKEQAKALGYSTEGVLKSIPNKSRASAVKGISKWLPWVSFATTVYMITYPRVLMTGNAYQVGRANNARRAAEAGAQRGPVPTNGGVRTPRDGTTDDLPTWADFRGHAR